MSFYRSYPNYLDLRNLRGGKLVKNGTLDKHNGKWNITYKRRFTSKTDYDVPERQIVSYAGGGDFPNGLMVVYPTEELQRVGNALTKHFIKECEKLDLKLENLSNAFKTALEEAETETNIKRAREHQAKLITDIDALRKTWRAETALARQAIEITPTQAPAKKEVEATTGGATR